MTSTSVVDKNGKPVSVGSRIKVLSLVQADFAHLTSSEFSKLTEQFIGRIFEVDEIDQYGQAWVVHMEQVSSNHYAVENVALSADEMELQVT